MPRIWLRNPDNTWTTEGKQVWVRVGNTWQIAKDIWIREAGSWRHSSGATGTYHPTAGTSVSGNWVPVGATSLVDAVDEATPNDGVDYVQPNDITSVCPTKTTYTVRYDVPVTGGVPPSGGETVTVKVRAQRVDINMVDLPQTTFTVRLLQGTTLIASSAGSLPTAWTTTGPTLTDAQKANITDWSQLKVEIEIQACVINGGGEAVRTQVTWVAIELS